jgi:autotransporter-associated beta strand protein
MSAQEIRTVLMVVSFAFLAPLGSLADNGTWTNTVTGQLWGDSANWLGGTVADGTTGSAFFNTLDIAADTTVRFNAARTINALILGDTFPASAGGWVLDNNSDGANILTLDGTTPTITVNAFGTGKSATISAILAGTVGLVKNGAGTLTLTGSNTYTGTTTIKAGTITVGDGTTGSLNGTTGTDLTFTGTGTFNVKEAASSAQGMGALTFSAGEGTVISTAATSGSSATLTFASMATRARGATANFALATNTTASVNMIVLTSTNNAPLSSSGSNNQGIFFGVADYARYDTLNGCFRAVSYGSDANAMTVAGGATIGATTAASDISISGNITAQTTGAAVNTIKSASAFTQAASSTISINGYFMTATGANKSFKPPTGGTSYVQPTIDGGEIVMAATTYIPANNNYLYFQSIIQNYGGGSLPTAVTIGGPGVVRLDAVNTYTGVTTVNSGILRTFRLFNGGIASSLGMSSAAAANLVINGGTWQNVAGNQTTDRLFTIGPAGATLDAFTISTPWTLSGTGSIAFSDTNAPASLTLTGTGTGIATLTPVLGDSGIGANITSLTKNDVSTWMLAGTNTYSGDTTINGGTLKASVFNAVPINSAVTVTGGIYDLGGFANVTNGAITMSSGAITNGTLVGSSYTLSGGTVYADLAGTNTLTKLGAGTVTLKGANTYSGETTVSAGTLALTTDTALGTTSALRIAATAKVDLAAGITATAGALYLDGKLQKKGIWGAPLTPGVNFTSESFTGTGKLTVQTGIPMGTQLLLY